MPTPPVPDSLVPLVRYLDGLTARAPLDELSARLHATDVRLDDVWEFALFDHQACRLNLLAAGPWYSLQVICWRSGQAGPVYDCTEASVVCKVLTGVGSETIRPLSAGGRFGPPRTRDGLVGTALAIQAEGLHQIFNLQPPGHNLVVLQLSSPPLSPVLPRPRR